MIKPAALLMGAAMVATAAGTYYGLELLPPGLIPPPIGRTVPAAQVATRPDPAPAVVAAAGAPATTPPPPAPVKSEPAEPAELEAAQPAPETSAPAPEAVASAAPTTAPAAVTAEADAIKPWWPDRSKVPANQLRLDYAGQVQGQGAIALLFSAPPKVDTLQEHVQVKSASGETVAGSWSLGKNPKLAVLGGLAPGRYTVILQPQVADEHGFMLGTTLTGPVYVKAQ